MKDCESLHDYITVYLRYECYDDGGSNRYECMSTPLPEDIQ
jgi:hypothetical protein